MFKEIAKIFKTMKGHEYSWCMGSHNADKMYYAITSYHYQVLGVDLDVSKPLAEGIKQHFLKREQVEESGVLYRQYHLQYLNHPDHDAYERYLAARGINSSNIGLSL